MRKIVCCCITFCCILSLLCSPSPVFAMNGNNVRARIIRNMREDLVGALSCAAVFSFGMIILNCTTELLVKVGVTICLFPNVNETDVCVWLDRILESR